eukprot:gene38106-49964_t
MLGAFAAWIMMDQLGINYWGALILAPLVVGILGMVIERVFLKHLYKLDEIYGLLLTFGLTLIAEGIFRELYGVSGQSYPVPELLQGATNLGFMVLPNYRAWVVLVSLSVCLGTWYLIERTRLGAYLRAGTENAPLVQAFGVNVPMMVMLTYGAGAALAALAGVLAAPIIQVNPLMGSNLIIVVFAVVVIGGMGSIMGAILTGLGLGVIEGFTKVFYPEASSTKNKADGMNMKKISTVVYALLLLALVLAPFFGAYPVFVMKLMCFALFAAAFNLLLGFTGLLSFGHAAFLGGSAYVAGHAMKVWGLTPELGLIAGTLTGAFLGWVFGVLAIRRQGIYFAMITLALAQMMFFVALQAKFTGGEDGLSLPTRSQIGLDLKDAATFYYVVLALGVGVFVGLQRLLNARLGQVLQGVRENETRMAAIGFPVYRYQLIAFVIAGGLAGLAGALLANQSGIVSPSLMHWSQSGSLMVMVILGGVGHLYGGVVGAVVLLLLEEVALGYTIHWQFGVGAVLLAVVLMAPRGIMGLFTRKEK